MSDFTSPIQTVPDPRWTVFAEIVGQEHWRTRDDEGFAARYADPFAFDPAFAEPPAAAVLPGSVEEIQAIVRAANDLRVPLWPVSRGKNLGYGGASPASPDTVVLDLGRMNRVLEINVELAYVVVEPGVSFFDLAQALRESGNELWPSVPDLGWGSVIGNALERGFGYTAFGDHSSKLCGLEVVLPNGELLRTGMGAQPDSDTFHLYKGGFGPSLDGLFLQSGLGIVVRAGVWVMPRPERAATCSISMPEPEDLASLAELIRPLQLDGTIEGVAIIGNALAVASGMMPRSAIWQEDGPMPLAAIKGFAEKVGVGYWNAKFGLYGAAEIVTAKLAVIRAAVGALPNAELEVREYAGDVDPSAVHPDDRSQLGIPSAELIQMAAWRGGTPAHTDFSLVCPTTGRDAADLVRQVRSIVEAAGLDHAGGFTMFGRHAVMLTLIAFDASDSEDRRRVRDLFGELVDALAASGHVPYRSHPAFMARISSLYDFNDGAHRRTVQAIKRALDPRGVLAPGKQGVWPLTDEAATR